MEVEARKPWFLAVGLMAFGVGLWLVLDAARSAGEDAARVADGAAVGDARRGLSDSVHSIPLAMPRF